MKVPQRKNYVIDLLKKGIDADSLRYKKSTDFAQMLTNLSDEFEVKQFNGEMIVLTRNSM